MNNPFNHKNFEMFKKFVSKQGGKIFCGIINKDGTVTTHGDKEMLEKSLSQEALPARRDSLSWVPPGPLPTIPRPLKEMQSYLHYGDIKKISTSYVNHFKNSGQKLGEVNKQYYCNHPHPHPQNINP